MFSPQVLLVVSYSGLLWHPKPEISITYTLLIRIHGFVGLEGWAKHLACLAAADATCRACQNALGMEHTKADTMMHACFGFAVLLDLYPSEKVTKAAQKEAKKHTHTHTHMLCPKPTFFPPRVEFISLFCLPLPKAIGYIRLGRAVPANNLKTS